MSLIQLSPYNYERIEVVLKIIQAADENVTSFSVSQVKQKNRNTLANCQIVWKMCCAAAFFFWWIHRQQASFSTWSPISESLLPLMLRTRICWKTAFCRTPSPTADCPSTCWCRPNTTGRLSVSQPLQAVLLSVPWLCWYQVKNLTFTLF